MFKDDTDNHWYDLKRSSDYICQETQHSRRGICLIRQRLWEITIVDELRKYRFKNAADTMQDFVKPGN